MFLCPREQQSSQPFGFSLSDCFKRVPVRTTGSCFDLNGNKCGAVLHHKVEFTEFAVSPILGEHLAALLLQKVSGELLPLHAKPPVVRLAALIASV